MNIVKLFDTRSTKSSSYAPEFDWANRQSGSVSFDLRVFKLTCQDFIYELSKDKPNNGSKINITNKS